MDKIEVKDNHYGELQKYQFWQWTRRNWTTIIIENYNIEVNDS